MFSSRLIDKNSNTGAINESEIYDRRYVEIVINQEKMLRIYYAHWWQSVTEGATVIEWAVNFRKIFCNALAIEHKYSNSLPINKARNYKKRRQQKLKVHIKILYENHSLVNSV